MSHTVLFTHLKFILLQYFQFSVFRCIQTDHSINKFIKLFYAPNGSQYQNGFPSILEEIIPILFSKMTSFF